MVEGYSAHVFVSGAWSCNFCGFWVEFRGDGTHTCPSCRCPLTVKRDPRTGEWAVLGVSVVPPAALAPLPESYCAEHPLHEAVGICERCGDFGCAACARFLEGRRYCPACVRLLRHQWAETSRRTSVVLVSLAVGALLLGYLVLFLLPYLPVKVIL
jgi:hypothetical protein